MSLMSLPKMVFSDSEGWTDLMRIHPSVEKMYVYYVMPMSMIPPAMIYYSGMKYGGLLVLEMTGDQLMIIAGIFLLAELVMVPFMGWLIQRLGEVVEMNPSYQDAFMLAAVAPTPLWLAPVFLFIPSLMLNLFIAAMALLASAALIFHGAHAVFKMEEKGHTLLMAGSIYAAGLVAWVFLMVLTLVVWNYV